MEFVNQVYEFIMYLINTIKGLVASLKGEETTTIKDATDESASDVATF